jgi:hypothetical protein
MMKQSVPKTPGPELYASVKAEFVRRGDSLNAYCRRIGVHRQWAAQVLLGQRGGLSARGLLDRILQEIS